MNIDEFELDLRRLLEKHKAWELTNLSIRTRPPTQSVYTRPDGRLMIEFRDPIVLDITIAVDEISHRRARER